MVKIIDEGYVPCADDDTKGQLDELIMAIKALKPGEVLSIKVVDRLNTLAEHLSREVNS